ncbi:MAG TPA: putative zinc-binding protein [Burkholderiales bacterium]|jgi:uncharacterized metal-binding protein
MIRVRPMPVLFACRGCVHERAAREAALELDRRGLGEAEPAGSRADKARSRYPVYAIEGCAQACAKRWLAAEGVEPVASFVLDPAAGLEAQIDEIAAVLGR